MAGILNNKQRILDTIITDLGRSQAALGEMRFQYYSFTDKHAFYEASGSNPVVASDATDRIYFEATDDHQDKICPETDFNGAISETFGKLMATGGELFYDGISSVPTIQGTDAFETMDVSKIASGVVGSTISNFEGQMMLSTIDPMVAISEREFEISPKKHTFEMANEGPSPHPVSFEWNTYYAAHPGIPQFKELSDFLYFWQDIHFAHLPNFQKLPPINKLPSNVEYSAVAPFLAGNTDLEAFETLAGWDYIKDIYSAIIEEGSWTALYGVHADNMAAGAPNMIGKTLGLVHRAKKLILSTENFNIENFKVAKNVQMAVYDDDWAVQGPGGTLATSNVLENIAATEANGVAAGYYTAPASTGAPNIVDFEFSQSSKANNIAFQIFDYGSSSVEKMAMVDAGEYPQANNSGENKRVIYVGKVIKAPPGSDEQLRFVRVFTIIFHNDDI